MPDLSLSEKLLGLSLALYIVCLPFNTFCVPTGCSDWPAWATLLFGWMLAGSGGANATWLANPLLFLGWAGMIRPDWRYFSVPRIIPALLAYAALALAVSFYFAKTVISNEAGLARPVTGYETGYWVWIASMVCFALCATVHLFERAHDDKPIP